MLVLVCAVDQHARMVGSRATLLLGLLIVSGCSQTATSLSEMTPAAPPQQPAAAQPQQSAAVSGSDAGHRGVAVTGGTPAVPDRAELVGGAGAAGTRGAAQSQTPTAGPPAAAAGSNSTPASPADLESCEPVPAGEQLAFPGAEGFGRFARGGRGGEVCHVTTLADEGPGSLRDCVSTGDRTVVFDVSGWITLNSNLGITVDRLTLAGQTAPGGGIGVRGQKLSIGGSDIVMRFMRVRRGIVKTTDRNDAMSVSSASSRVIIDHCSVGFGTDENLSMPGDEGVGPRDLTVQWTVIAWGLQRNNHSAGSLLTANGTTLHHSVYAFNGTRNPKARSQDGAVLDFVNNVIYGWNAPDPVGEAMGWGISKQAFLLADTANGEHRANAVGNYFVAHGERAAEQAFSAGSKNEAGVPTFKLFFDDNLLDGNANGMLDASRSDWSMVGTAEQLPQRLAAPQVCTQGARAAYERVLSYVGAVVPARDDVDGALVEAIRTQSGKKIHDESELNVGAEGYGELRAGTAPADSDGDGMPDSWESARGVQDSNADRDGDGYTNLEEYLNELARPAFPQN